MSKRKMTNKIKQLSVYIFLFGYIEMYFSFIYIYIYIFSITIYGQGAKITLNQLIGGYLIKSCVKMFYTTT